VYRPAHFAEDRLDVLHGVIRTRPLVTLVTSRGGTLEADHVPVLLDATAGSFGTLHGHVARANDLWKAVRPGSEALAVFRAEDHYVSPAWYPAKREHGRVVPTWNYVVVHARGPIRFTEDREWLRALVTRLTDTHESTRDEPWRVTDAPADYIEAMLRAIVGFEIEVTALTGKWKMSQNRSPADRAGIAAGLAAQAGRRGD
jgi:transcriptional regulator